MMSTTRGRAERQGGDSSLNLKHYATKKTRAERMLDMALLMGGNTSLNLNHYATKKTVAGSMLDVALLMANAAQLKAVLEQGPDFRYYVTVVVLIGSSLLFQVLAGVLFVAMARKDLNDVANQRKLDIMNNVATGLVFITAIINIFITAFGVQKTGLYPKT